MIPASPQRESASKGVPPMYVLSCQPAAQARGGRSCVYHPEQERARQEKSFHRRAKELGYEVHRPPAMPA